MAEIQEVQYSVFFGSPLKPKVGIENLEASLRGFGYRFQYHLTTSSPKVFRKASEAKHAALLTGKSLLAVARSNCQEKLPDILDNAELEESKKRSKGPADMDEEAKYLIADGLSIPSRKKQTLEEHRLMEADIGKGAAANYELMKVEEHELVASDADQCEINALFNQHNRQISEKLTKLLEDISGLKESHKKLTLDHQKLNEDHKKLTLDHQKLNEGHQQLAIEYRIFGAQGTTRTLVVMDLLALEASLMDWFLQQEAAKSDVEECEQLASMIKDITFFDFWWFMINEAFYRGNPEFNIHRFWQQKLDYQPSLGLLLARSKQFPVVCSPSSRHMAMKAYDWLKMAAKNLMASFKADRSMRTDVLVMTSCEAENIARFMTTDIVIDSLGFYISVPRNPRNGTIHLLENLILWPEDQKEKKRKKRSAKPYYRKEEQAKGSWAQQAKSGKHQTDGFPLKINLKVVDKAINFLTEIINGLDGLEGELNAIRTNIEWFAKALLDHCVHALSEGNSQLASFS